MEAAKMPGLMLTEELKDDIQGAYSRLLDARGFKARYCQKLMIAEIARILGGIETNEHDEREPGPNTCVVEAGTGTGKTMAYILASLPVAMALGKKLVISTATVALQEQIIKLDLPDIRQHASPNMTFALAKGRRRYLCLSRLELALGQSDNQHQTLSLFDDEPQGYMDQQLYQQMQDQLNRGEWNGDRDDWPDEIPGQSWTPISTDHIRCTGRQCKHYDNCIFFRARERTYRVDCIVTNHDLVLADLMGGGGVLPAPEDAIYIFDEGHHLPEKATNHFSGVMSVRSSQIWLQQIPTTLQMIDAQVPGVMADSERSLIDVQVSDLVTSLETALTLAAPLSDAANGGRFADREATWRFPMGEVPEEIRDHAADLGRQFESCARVITVLEDRMKNRLEAEDSMEHWLSEVSGMIEKLESATGLCNLYSQPDSESRPPYARWLVFSGEEKLSQPKSAQPTSSQTGAKPETWSSSQAKADRELRIHASPISISDTLHELFWSRCFGAVVTSATLSEGGDFSRFRKRSGINEENRFVSLPSPFNFQQQGVLNIPSMNADPGAPDAHTEAIAALIPQLLAEENAALVLFTSWRQMHGVLDDLDDAFSARVLQQGELSRSEIMKIHRERIDAGQKSCIFGQASFAEGIDLPGKYCDHVVISKIPFAVPDDPVGATLAEWIESRGGNSFEEIMLPDAALRMVQACGRLLRTETDKGTVTILDRRLVTRRYGKRLQHALPPFRREIGA